jgi:hypothetical protein
VEALKRNTTAHNNVYSHTGKIMLQKLSIKLYTKTDHSTSSWNLSSWPSGIALVQICDPTGLHRPGLCLVYIFSSVF